MLEEVVWVVKEAVVLEEAAAEAVGEETPGRLRVTPAAPQMLMAKSVDTINKARVRFTSYKLVVVVSKLRAEHTRYFILIADSGKLCQ